MKILVIDDSPKHLASAKILEQNGHEVTCTDSYMEGVRLVQLGGFDAVLADLLMPAEEFQLGGEGLSFFGHETPIGFAFALIAAQAGISKVAVVTDTNHHHHPMSAAIDWVKKPLVVNGSTVQFMHAVLNEDGSKNWEHALKILFSI